MGPFGLGYRGRGLWEGDRWGAQFFFFPATLTPHFFGFCPAPSCWQPYVAKAEAAKAAFAKLTAATAAK